LPLGGPEQKLADFDEAPAAPAWSLDGKFLVVAKYHPDQQAPVDAGALFLVPVEGGEPRPLLSPAAGQYYQYPAISPDGRSMAFASCAGSLTTGNCDLRVVGLTADLRPQGKPRQLASAVTNVAGIAWTPNGQSLLYGAHPAGEGFLFRIDLAGSGEPKRLEIASRGASYPAVARKGDRLAFSRSVSDFDVWRVEAGGHPQPFLVSTAADSGSHKYPNKNIR
jgi:Tol biopolymer transport system component